MNYKSYLDELAFFNVNNINLGLEPISFFLKRLGNPHDAYPTVLIGGTNGKGSISAMIAEVLRRSGLRTGLYTSPHLIDVRERIRINGEMISPDDMSLIVSELRSLQTQELTYFEFITAVAMVYFQRKKVDIAVLEVGMGGRLDATNVVTPLVAVISNVAMDHMEYLGHTPAAIAGEKGGIIKEGGLCLTAAKDRDVLGVLEEIATKKKARLKRLGREIRLVRHRDGTISVSDELGTIHRLKCALIGRHQQDNAAMAVAASRELARRGFIIGDEEIRSGLAAVRWDGRLEVVNRQPLTILDGAHNFAAVKVLCSALKRSFSFRKLIIIFGVLADKDFRPMLRKLAKMADILVLTRPDSSRAVPPAALLPLAAPLCRQVLNQENPALAITTALSLAAADDLVVITGSLYLIGQVKKILTAAPAAEKDVT